ncbi:hypothetical protein [Ornithinimicrobium avium]|uniref:Uncharacterized protein n=1 Tax=Ornithinimicrobium avium TaxID=2283195 RepID=A0A345NLJ5_9MICO|nr:hypothetical protein [Ornithinimicrobium avium]AXH95903.1 hypothetical protein DV701_06965 [Ornithinimicrobium avium]
MTDLWTDLRSASRAQLTVRGAGLIGALLFTGSFVLAGGGGPVSWAGLVLLSLLVVVQPHTIAPALFVVFAAASWWVGVDGPWHWALLPAALGLLLVHVGTALAASVPAQAPLPASVLRRWSLRTGLVAAVTTGVWGAAGVLVALATGAGGAVPGIVGLALAAGCLVACLRNVGSSR